MKGHGKERLTMSNDSYKQKKGKIKNFYRYSDLKNELCTGFKSNSIIYEKRD
jgi:hypothetical protein